MIYQSLIYQVGSCLLETSPRVEQSLARIPSLPAFAQGGPDTNQRSICMLWDEEGSL